MELPKLIEKLREERAKVSTISSAALEQLDSTMFEAEEGRPQEARPEIHGRSGPERSF